MSTLDEIVLTDPAYQLFGLPVPPTATTRWGARALLDRGGGYSLLPDRQDFQSSFPHDSSQRALFKYFSTTCLSTLTKAMTFETTPSMGQDERDSMERAYVVLSVANRFGVVGISTEIEGQQFYFRATTHGREGGYLYLCAWAGKDLDDLAWNNWFSNYYNNDRKQYAFVDLPFDVLGPE